MVTGSGKRSTGGSERESAVRLSTSRALTWRAAEVWARRMAFMTAREFDLPVVLHARRAVEEITATLRSIGGLRGVVHSYSGSEEQARQLFGMGFMSIWKELWPES